MFSTRVMTTQLPSIGIAAARRRSVWRTCCQQQDELGRRPSERRSLRGIAPADALLKSLGGAASFCITAQYRLRPALMSADARSTMHLYLVCADIVQQSGVERATTSVVMGEDPSLKKWRELDNKVIKHGINKCLLRAFGPAFTNEHMLSMRVWFMCSAGSKVVVAST